LYNILHTKNYRFQQKEIDFFDPLHESPPLKALKTQFEVTISSAAYFLGLEIKKD